MWTRSSSNIRWKEEEESSASSTNMETFNLTYEDNSLSSLLPQPKSISNYPKQRAYSTLIRTPYTSPTRHQTVLLICFLVTALMLFSNPVEAGIDCFKCVSVNGDNPSCEDPFHNNYSVSILESPCMGGRKGRNGLFPATACIKLAGIYDDTKESVTVRGCALDSGTLTTDTEIVRMSHCGGFFFGQRYVKGCLQSCDDADGCNSSSQTKFSLLIFSTLQMTIVLCMHFWSKIF